MLLILMFFCRAFERRVIEKNGKYKWLQKLTDKAMMLIFPAMGLITIAMVYAYYKEISFARTLDAVFHERLSPAAAMLAEHGLKPFGTYFDMIGSGGSTIRNAQEYTFIDSSYPQILIRYGFVTYIVANVLWVYTTWKALKTGNRRISYVMSLLALDFVMEHHWYELSYNVFILIPYADFIGSTIDKESVFEKAINDLKERWKYNKYVFAFTLTSLCQLLVVFFLLPTAFSWLRTIINGYGLYGAGKKIFIGLTVVFIMTLIFIWNLSCVMAIMISQKKIKRVNVVPFVFACVIGLGFLIVGNVLINRVIVESKARIEKEREILELITSKTSGKVYADKLPEVYIRSIKGISRSYLCGEDFARYDNATIIIDASWDSQCLDAKGFLYLPISEEEAIYTNDDCVINSLKDNGYKLKGYNSYEHKVDLMDLAEMNDVKILNNGGIQLVGTEHQIIHGPYITIYSGSFTARFVMKLLKDDYSVDDRICTIKISSYNGTQIKNTADIYRSDFDDEGNLDYEVVFDGEGQNYEFLVFTEEGKELEIDSITYRRSPDYDAHKKIDNKGRVKRVEYYDLEGNPKAVSDGYYGCEYIYDDNDNVLVQRFLGEDLKPMLLSEGYAEIHREYSIKREVIRESYYGIDGEAVELPVGYHAVGKEYDFSGKLITESYYNLEGEPVMTYWGYATSKRIYNSKEQLIRVEYFDVNNEKVMLRDGYSTIEFEYDSTGKNVKIVLKDVDGNVVNEHIVE